jgi:hypothetical protein
LIATANPRLNTTESIKIHRKRSFPFLAGN